MWPFKRKQLALKFCKDCAHFVDNWNCDAKPQITETSLVTGEITMRYRSAGHYRDFEDECGRDARWFAPKLEGENNGVE